jgi:hypothetical protein
MLPIYYHGAGRGDRSLVPAKVHGSTNVGAVSFIIVMVVKCLIWGRVVARKS